MQLTSEVKMLLFRRIVFVSFSLIFLNGVALTPKAFGQTTYVQELNRLDAVPGQKELFARLLALEPFTRLPSPTAQLEIKETLDWLARKGVRAPGSVRYTYNYAIWLWKAGIYDSASVIYAFATIKARSDAARCADETSAPDRIKDYESSLGNAVKSNLANLNNQIKTEIFRLATLDLESKLPIQPKDTWLCGGGVSFFKKYAEKHVNLNEKSVDTPLGMVGRAVVVEDYDIKPDFIEDQDWLVKRRAATNAQVEVLRKFLLDQGQIK